MKKLMIAAAIVCAAAYAQAAALAWGNAGIQTTGDFDAGEGDYATGYMVYIVNADTYSQAAVLAAIQAADAGKIGTYMDSIKADNALGGADGKIMKSFDIGDATAYNGFLVIFDAATADAADYVFVSDTYAATITTLGGKFDYDGEQYVNALDYSTAGQDGSNWKAVPEPTSGLLLLLGVAGLALKRRRA